MREQRWVGLPGRERWLRAYHLGALWITILAAWLPGAVAIAQTGARSETAISIIRDVVYGHKDGMGLVYDVIQPEEPNGAAIAYIVSGGWQSVWEPPEERARGLGPLLDLGFTVMVVHHGSAPRYKVPDAIADVRRAIRHIRLASRVYGTDPERIGVFGGSAGGHLALMLGLASDAGDPEASDPVLRVSDRVQAVVAYYPPVDLRDQVGESRRFPALDFPAEQAPEASPITHVSPDDPPVLLVHGDRDKLVSPDNSRRLGEELKQAGVPTQVVMIPGADHGFRTPTQRSRATAAMVQWFVRHLDGLSLDLPVGPPARSRMRRRDLRPSDPDAREVTGGSEVPLDPQQ